MRDTISVPHFLWELLPQYLHRDKSVINHDFFCQEISSYCGFVLVTELLIYILVHQWGLPNSKEKKKSQDNIQNIRWAGEKWNRKCQCDELIGEKQKKGSMLYVLEWVFHYQTRFNSLTQVSSLQRATRHRFLLLSHPFSFDASIQYHSPRVSKDNDFE